MPGHFGNGRTTVQNLTIADIKLEQNLLLIKGAVPGATNSFVIIKEAKKRKALNEISSQAQNAAQNETPSQEQVVTPNETPNQEQDSARNETQNQEQETPQEDQE